MDKLYGFDEWADSCVDWVPGSRVTPGALYSSYAAWCALRPGCYRLTMRRWGDELVARGAVRMKSNGVRWLVGVRLIPFVG